MKKIIETTAHKISQEVNQTVIQTMKSSGHWCKTKEIKVIKMMKRLRVVCGNVD